MPLVSHKEHYVSEQYFGVFGHEAYLFSCVMVVRVELKGSKPNFGANQWGKEMSCLSLTEALPAQLMLTSVWRYKACSASVKSPKIGESRRESPIAVENPRRSSKAFENLKPLKICENL